MLKLSYFAKRLKTVINKILSTRIGPTHEILELTASASSKCSNEPAHMRRLVRAFVHRIHKVHK